MTMTVLDSTDTAGILADAGVTLDQPADKPAEGEAKPEVKVDAKTPEPQDDPDDVEGDDGLTPRQKRELTQTMQKAIGKKHRQRMEAEEFAAAQFSEKQLAIQRAEKLEREISELKAKMAPPAAAPEAPQKPLRENFANDSDWVDAMIQFGVTERLAEKAKEDQKAAEERAHQERMNATAKRIQRAFELVPDFEAVVGAVDTQIPGAVAGYLENADMVAELSYYLAKNPDVLVSLSKLTPIEQLVKIGKIESTLSPFEPKAAQHDEKSSKESSNGQAKPAPSADTDIDLSKPRGKAAPVITPLEGTGSAGITKDSKDMNIREAIEDFSKRNRVNLGIRKRH